MRGLHERMRYDGAAGEVPLAGAADPDPLCGEEPAARHGARRFGVEVFEPSTSNVLMAALLVHDLRTVADEQPERQHPFAMEAAAAAHGGLWRQPYSPRSVLGLAVLVGVGGSRP